MVSYHFGQHWKRNPYIQIRSMRTRCELVLFSYKIREKKIRQRKITREKRRGSISVNQIYICVLYTKGNFRCIRFTCNIKLFVDVEIFHMMKNVHWQSLISIHQLFTGFDLFTMQHITKWGRETERGEHRRKQNIVSVNASGFDAFICGCEEYILTTAVNGTFDGRKITIHIQDTKQTLHCIRCI